MHADQEQDARRPFRLQVDVLATPEQVQRLQQVIGEALCAAPEDHPGPCRIAWSMGHLDGAQVTEDGSSGLTPQDVASVREHLLPVPVWAREDVDRSLGL
ncbi:hypothetical protein [Kineococcus sp. SYSU DK018]|uniref:hypothetical protein n=1 Tax=Kineococcus sp. SYSU DK018 TaxID=3383139 RepID=UPI003D7E6623